MASMQMCKPACEATYAEAEQMEYSTGSQSYSSKYKHYEHQSSGHSTNHAQQHSTAGQMHKNPCHSGHSSGIHGLAEKVTGLFSHSGSSHGHSNSHGHHGHNGSAHSHTGSTHGHSLTQHGSSHQGYSGSTKCHTGSNHGHGHNATHGHGHNLAHGHHGSAHLHLASGVYTEKKEGHKTCNSGNMKTEVYVKKKNSYKGDCRDGGDSSSDSESDDEGCRKRC